MNEVKTLNINDVNYEIVDEKARTDLNQEITDRTLENNNILNSLIDVVTEINNEVINRKNADESIQSDLSEEVNDRKSEDEKLQLQIKGLSSGSPKGVYSSVSEIVSNNPETGVYINTTDGHIYSWVHDGAEAIDLGEYQSSGIAPESIDYLMLDETLKNMYIEDIEFLTLPDYITGSVLSINSEKLVLTANQYFSYYKIDISSYIGKLLFFTANSYGNYYACVITDENDNVIFNSPKTGISSKIYSSGYVKVNNSMKYMYLQANASASNRIEFAFIHVGVIKKLNLKLNYNESTLLESISSLEKSYINPDNPIDTQGQIKISSLSSSSTVLFELFKMSAGYKYIIEGINGTAFSRCGFVLCDNNLKVKTKSTDLYEYDTRFMHEFIAEYDGYIGITNNTTYDSNKVYVHQFDKMKNDETDGIFSNLKIGFTGDSICAGSGYVGGYAKILQDEYGLNIQNIGVSGGHITHDRDDVFLISDSIDDLDEDCDAYIIEGGINDYSNAVNFGSISPNYTDDVDDTTFCGALEKTFRALYTNFPGKRFAFLIVHNVKNTYFTKLTNNKTWKDFRDVIYELGEKYGIHIIDVGKSSLNTYSDTMKQNYTSFNADGLHPNKDGYSKFYVPLLVEWIKTL